MRSGVAGRLRPNASIISWSSASATWSTCSGNLKPFTTPSARIRACEITPLVSALCRLLVAVLPPVAKSNARAVWEGSCGIITGRRLDTGTNHRNLAACKRQISRGGGGTEILQSTVAGEIPSPPPDPGSPDKPIQTLHACNFFDGVVMKGCAVQQSERLGSRGYRRTIRSIA